MPTGNFSRLNPESFLQTFVSQSVEVGAALGCTHCQDCGSYIEQLGVTASEFFEDAFRDEFGVSDALNRETYADLIVALKNRIGGNFSRASGERDVIRVVSTRCPFGTPVKEAPALCQMTSSVFGGIAARNFGYAKVVLEKRIAVGDNVCQVSIYLDRGLAAEVAGDEYHSEEGRVLSPSGSHEISDRVTERMHKVWKSAREGDPAPLDRRPYLVAEAPATLRALETVDVVAPTTATVLVTGETGVGKELIARAVHAMSKRWKKRFVAVNCGAIPDNLIESVLFGHERGAFTGAFEVHHGLFERADGGTLFLDEVDSLPLAAQVRLLRVLQGGDFERVGGKQSMRADARIVAAASRPLRQLVNEGKFRKDLYYRLNVVPITIPPLRERPEEIPHLVAYFLAQLSEKYGKSVTGVTERALGEIMAYHWPGNVRELENVLERSFLFARGSLLEGLRLHDEGQATEEARDAESPNVPADMPLKDAKKIAADKVENVILKEKLRCHHGNVSAVAKALSLTPRAVHQKLNTHRIDAASYRSKAREHRSPPVIPG